MDNLMNREVVLPVFISFLISAISGPVLIPFLRRLKVSQTVREEGPDTHLRKSGTPTMGGIMILASVAATSLLFLEDAPDMIPVLFMTLGFGLIGFLDDYIKVVLVRSMGLKAWQKMLLQIVVTAIFCYYMRELSGHSMKMLIPFSDGSYLDMGYLEIPFLFIVVLGTVNGANFTDGLDGLASSVTLIMSVFFAVISVWSASELTPLIVSVSGALLGFLLFNVYPARVFMGDTGSLALGGFVAATAYMLQMPLFILLVGCIYLVEIISVMLQVIFYRLSGGRRLFKMAPIHHHFELCGWSETRIVAVFGICTTILCLIAYTAL